MPATNAIPHANTWERFEGLGEPLTLSVLILKLQDIYHEHGDLSCHLRNYLEENTVAPITDVQMDGDNVVLESNDGTDDERTI